MFHMVTVINVLLAKQKMNLPVWLSTTCTSFNPNNEQNTAFRKILAYAIPILDANFVESRPGGLALEAHESANFRNEVFFLCCSHASSITRFPSRLDSICLAGRSPEI